MVLILMAIHLVIRLDINGYGYSIQNWLNANHNIGQTSLMSIVAENYCFTVQSSNVSYVGHDHGVGNVPAPVSRRLHMLAVSLVESLVTWPHNVQPCVHASWPTELQQQYNDSHNAINIHVIS